MNPLLWVFEFVFRCRHRELSRVFTIKQRRTRSASSADASSSVRKLDATALTGRLGVTLQGLKSRSNPEFDTSRRDQGMGSSIPDVSYLAQTRKSPPVILYSVECVARATTPNS